MLKQSSRTTSPHLEKLTPQTAFKISVIHAGNPPPRPTKSANFSTRKVNQQKFSSSAQETTETHLTFKRVRKFEQLNNYFQSETKQLDDKICQLARQISSNIEAKQTENNYQLYAHQIDFCLDRFALGIYTIQQVLKILDTPQLTNYPDLKQKIREAVQGYADEIFQNLTNIFKLQQQYFQENVARYTATITSKSYQDSQQEYSRLMQEYRGNILQRDTKESHALISRLMKLEKQLKAPILEESNLTTFIEGDLNQLREESLATLKSVQEKGYHIRDKITALECKLSTAIYDIYHKYLLCQAKLRVFPTFTDLTRQTEYIHFRQSRNACNPGTYAGMYAYPKDNQANAKVNTDQKEAVVDTSPQKK